MKPKIIFRTVVLVGLASLSFSEVALEAQNFVYTSRDLVLAFRRSGSSDLAVDLGPIDSFTSLAPGQTLNLNSRFDVNSQLLGTFGGLDSLTYSVIGTHKAGLAGGAEAANTSWLTLARSDPNTPTSAPGRYTASKSQNIQSAISGILGDGSSSGALAYSSSASYPPSSTTAIVIPTVGTAAQNSFTTKFTAIGGLKSLITSPGIENTTSATFSSTAGALARSDLYEYLPGSAGSPASFLGYFTLENNGQFEFTAVPEPGAHVSIFGAALLGGALWFRSRKHTLSSQNPQTKERTVTITEIEL